jgi:hypothetical protein
MTARKLPRKGRFYLQPLDVRLVSSRAKKSAGVHYIGRPPTNYRALPSAAVDVIADRLAAYKALKTDDLAKTLRDAVLSAHAAASRKIAPLIFPDAAGRASVGFRAIRALCDLVYDPSFIPAIQFTIPFAEAEHPTFGDEARDLARALGHVPLLEGILADAVRNLKPVKGQNPGKPYMAELVKSLVAFWHEMTGEFPAKTRVLAMKSKSRRVLFWDFLDRALADLSLQHQPTAHHVLKAVELLQKGKTPPPK